MAVCPQLTDITPDTFILTKELLTELIVSDFSRAAGTTVNVECREGYFLHGPSTVTCQLNRVWSGNPYCSSNYFTNIRKDNNDRVGVNPNEVVETPTINMNKDELVIIIGSSVASLIVLALIIFVVAVLCFGRRREKNIIRYREAEPYREDGSHGAYSISGQKPINDQMQMYNVYSHRPVPLPGSTLTPMPTHRLHQTPSMVTGRGSCPYCIHCRDQEIHRREAHHCSHCHVQDRPRREVHKCTHCYERGVSRGAAHHCKDCCEALNGDIYHVHQREYPSAYQQGFTRQLGTVSPLSTGNDVVVRREVLLESDADDDTYTDQRRDGNIWRGMYDAGWAIPRPNYE